MRTYNVLLAVGHSAHGLEDPFDQLVRAEISKKRNGKAKDVKGN